MEGAGLARGERGSVRGGALWGQELGVLEEVAAPCGSSPLSQQQVE